VGSNTRAYSRVIKAVRDIRKNKWNYLDFSYFRKWILVGFVLGIAAGLGSIGLYLGVGFFTSLFLVSGSGYVPHYQEVFTLELPIL
jgi:chloride channel protein, CIC family